MCGIWAYLSKQRVHLSPRLTKSFEQIGHRGPDFSTLNQITPNLIFGFHRLAIIDPGTASNQPLVRGTPPLTLICNGEIYNYCQLWSEVEQTPLTGSDCEVILPLYQQFGIGETVEKLQAEFSFILYDPVKNQLHVARDRFGVRPLFWMYSSQTGELCFSSEAKGLISAKERDAKEDLFQPFPPGHYTTIHLNQLNSQGEIHFQIDPPKPYGQFGRILREDSLSESYQRIYQLLTKSVKQRLMSDRPIGALLSGGLDSSLITCLAVNLLSESQLENFHCFSIGLEGSVDLIAAKKVANALKLKNHHVVHFTVEEGFQALDAVIRQLESYDVTTIRASIPQYLLAKYVANQTSVRVLLSGEGADELFAGYQYFKKSPDPESLKGESRCLLNELYLFDNLRTDRTTSAHGLEVRVPFLDRDLVNYVDSISANYRMCENETDNLEKLLLRMSFHPDTLSLSGEELGLKLPIDILMRRKEAFSDAVSSQTTCWYQSLVSQIEAKLLNMFPGSSLNDIMETQSKTYQGNPPPTLEALYYRIVFEQNYPGHAADLINHYWMPKWVNLTSWDPSATQLSCHQGDLSRN